MKLKEYFEKNPGLLSQFKKCASKDEFMNVAQANNIRFSGDKLDEVYEYILSTENNDALSEEALEKASGGTSIEFNPKKVATETEVTEIGPLGTIFGEKLEDLSQNDTEC